MTNKRKVIYGDKIGGDVVVGDKVVGDKVLGSRSVVIAGRRSGVVISGDGNVVVGDVVTTGAAPRFTTPEREMLEGAHSDLKAAISKVITVGVEHDHHELIAAQTHIRNARRALNRLLGAT